MKDVIVVMDHKVLKHLGLKQTDFSPRTKAKTNIAGEVSPEFTAKNLLFFSGRKIESTLFANY